MTLRGRLTLVAGLALGLGLLTLANGGGEHGRASAAVGPSTPAAAAALASRSEPTAPPPVRPIPAGLLARLPLESRLFPAEATPGTRLTEAVRMQGERFQVEYTLDVALGRAVRRVLRRSRVALGTVVVLDPASGEVLAYASTDPERLPPTAAHPAASLIKVVTAAESIDRAPERADGWCRSVGNPWRLRPAHLDRPAGGRTISLGRALATSNNQCFAQLAVHAVGREPLLAAIRRFGLLESPGPGHDAGEADDPGDDPFALGRLGCGLAGCRITPLHAARLAASLAEGELVTPHWVARVRDASGRERALPPAPAPRRVLERSTAKRLRELLVQTTERGTARRAFRTRRGPLLQGIEVAGKTGSLNGRDPDGRYEWFMGTAPAEAPRIAVAVLTVHGDLWYATPAQIAAEVLKELFCPKGVCRAAAVERYRDGSA